MTRRAMPSGLDLVVRPARAEASLWRRFRFEEEIGCRELLFDRYAPLARSVAAREYHRRASARLDQGDFRQLAYEGLLQAIDRFDPLRHVPFEAYARRRIGGCIVDGIASMTEVGTQIRHRRRMEQGRLRSLASAEAAAADNPLEALSDLALGLALGLMLEGTNLIAGADSADPRPSAYESLEWREMQHRVAREVARLPANEATVVRQHYDNGLSFAQVAELIGLSRGRVSQLHRSALEKLRKRMGNFG